MTYQVDHETWCYWTAHRSCCGHPADRVEDECDCGAAETQGVIDRLEARLDRVRRVVSTWGSAGPLKHQADKFMAVLDEALNGELA